MVAAAAVVAVSAQAAQSADSTNGSAPATESDTLSEIIVTAERVQENAQKTPISMSVYNRKEIQNEEIHDIQSLTRVDPSINISTQTGSAYVAIRGIASTDFTELGDPSIAISRDGFFTNRPFGLFASLYDLSQIEVLKGPQGTLYGRNSVGGEISIISQRPTDQFGGYLNVEAGSYDAMNLEGAVNLPLSNAVEVRVSAISRYHEGYRDNPGFPNGDDEDNKSARAQLSFQPWEKFNGWLSVQSDRTGGTGDVAYSGPLGTSGYGVVVDPITPPAPYNLAGGFPIAAPFTEDNRDTRYRWEFSQGLPGDLTLTYLGGYDEDYNAEWQDATSLPFASSPTRQFLTAQDVNTQNEEIRLASTPDQRLFWQVGAFYFHEINDPDIAELHYESGTFDGDNGISARYAVNTSSEAAFGQLTFKLIDSVKLSAGLRYTEDHKSQTGESVLDITALTGGAAHIPVPPGCTVSPVFTCTSIIATNPGLGSVSSSKMTYHAGIDWTPTDANLLYVKYDTGYKGGGFNASNGVNASLAYNPETIESLEFGSKNRFLQDRVQANLAIFYMDYNGYQASQFTNATSGTAPATFNAGDANDYGAEAQLIVLIDPTTRFDLSGTLLHAQFTSGHAVDATVSDAACSPLIPHCASVPLDGNVLPNAPRVSARAGLQHTWSGLAEGDWTARIEGKYQSQIYFDIFNHPDTSQENYTLGDASLNYASAQGHWDLLAYVHNFTDRAIIQQAWRNTTAGIEQYEFAPPRTYGLKLSAHF